MRGTRGTYRSTSEDPPSEDPLLVNFKAYTTDQVIGLSIKNKYTVAKTYFTQHPDFDVKTHFAIAPNRIEKVKHLLDHQHINYRILGVFGLPEDDEDGKVYTMECYTFLMGYIGDPSKDKHPDDPTKDNMVKRMILERLYEGYMFHGVVKWDDVLHAVIRGKVKVEVRRYLSDIVDAILYDQPETSEETPRTQARIEELLDGILSHQNIEICEHFRVLLQIIFNNEDAVRYVFEKHIRPRHITEAEENLSC